MFCQLCQNKHILINYKKMYNKKNKILSKKQNLKFHNGYNIQNSKNRYTELY